MDRKNLILLFVPIFLLGAILLVNTSSEMNGDIENPDQLINSPTEKSIAKEDLSLATFAGGCFWCTEAGFEKYDGVYYVISGYTGGELVNPTYKDVSGGTTRHIESIQVYYDENIITYDDLLEILIRQIDPTDGQGSFVDRGYQYTSAIFYHNEDQRIAAESFLKGYNESGFYDSPIATQILEAGPFYDAEDYHQDYYKKNQVRYNLYRAASGRDRYIQSQWGDDKEYIVPKRGEEKSREEIAASLTELQRRVTLQNATERAFNNEYWDNTEEGIYVDHFSGEPLFSSTDKYKSGTGWPSFTKPINEENIILREDKSLFYTRIEARSNIGDAHLGHVFEDGPAPDYLRYCMNSAAMKFIPKDQMAEVGYGNYLYLFE